MAFLKLFLGPHYCDGQNVSRAKAKGGAKVEGLFDLPTSWTPPFVVVSLGSYPPDSNRIAELRRCLLGSNQWSLPSKLISKKADRLIVRSSANIEDIDARGWLTSRQSASGIDDVLQVFETVWSYSRQALDELDSHASLSLIIQRFHQPQLHGHLSNERRVSRSHKQWRFEIESPEKSAKTSAIRTHNLVKHVGKKGLICGSESELRQRLSEVAEWSSQDAVRIHYEWSWDGNRLWIVQRDVEVTRTGGKPSSSSCDIKFNNTTPQTTIFVDGVSALKPWKKIESLRVFGDAGLTSAKLFVLESSNVIRNLMAGNVSARLRKDLTQLCASPIVFRTDKLTDSDDVNFLAASLN